MKCTHIKQLLPLYTGGDLPIQQADSVRAHLFVCQQCNDLAVDFSESSAWLNSEGRIDFDDRFFDELRDSVWRSVRTEQTDRPQTKWRYSWFLLFASAAAAIAVLAALPLLRSRNVTTPPKVEVAMETKGPDLLPPDLLPKVADASAVTVPTSRRNNRLSVHRYGIATVIPVTKSESPASSESSKAGLQEVASSTNIIRRIEIQTADPTIRIIWLVREPAAPVPTQVETED